MKRKKTKRKTGSRLGLLLAAVLCAAALSAAPKNKQTEFALISGSVFREPGYAVRGAEVALIPDDAAKKLKVRRMQTVTDARGEFFFRVPPAAAGYTVKVRAANLTPQEKAATVSGDERVDVTFLLVAASK